MKHTITKLMALFMCLITLFSFVPAVASADGDPFPQNVTIESEKNNAFDYVEIERNLLAIPDNEAPGAETPG